MTEIVQFCIAIKHYMLLSLYNIIILTTESGNISRYNMFKVTNCCVLIVGKIIYYEHIPVVSVQENTESSLASLFLKVCI